MGSSINSFSATRVPAQKLTSIAGVLLVLASLIAVMSFSNLKYQLESDIVQSYDDRLLQRGGYVLTCDCDECSGGAILLDGLPSTTRPNSTRALTISIV